jgi:hypothetical protein
MMSGRRKAWRNHADTDTDTDATADVGYLDLDGLARYSGLSVSSLRRYLIAAEHPLPHHRIGRRVLVDKREFDAWVRDAARHADRVVDRARSDDPSDTDWVRRGFGKP